MFKNIYIFGFSLVISKTLKKKKGRQKRHTRTFSIFLTEAACLNQRLNRKPASGPKCKINKDYFEH